MAAQGEDPREALRYSVFVPLLEEAIEGVASGGEVAPISSTGPSSSSKNRSKLVELGSVAEVREKLSVLMDLATSLGQVDRVTNLLRLYARLEEIEEQAVSRYGDYHHEDLRISVKVPVGGASLFTAPAPSSSSSSENRCKKEAQFGHPEDFEDASHDMHELLSDEEEAGPGGEGVGPGEEEGEFDCPICYEAVAGGEGRMLLGCEHRYCRECFVGYFEGKIREADVQTLKCPSPQCEAKAEAYELEALLSEESFGRYLHFLALSRLKEDQAMCWCPTEQCREPVLAAAGGEVQCPSCQTSF